MKSKGLKSATLINLVTGILTFVIQLGINFFLSPYIVRTLGEEANGFTQLANNFVSYAGLITLAFNSMGGRFMTVNFHQNNLKKAKEYYSSICVCNIAMVSLMVPACIIILIKLNSVIEIGNADARDVRMLFGCVFANYFAGLFLSIYNMAMFVKNKLYIVNIVNVLRNILNAIILFGLFYFLPAKMYYVSLTAMILTLGSIPMFKVMQRRILPEVKFSWGFFRFSAVKELLKSGIWNTLNQCGNMLMTGLDLLLANLFINPVAMGVLSVAKTIPTAIASLAGVLNTSFSPSLTINWAKGNKAETIKTLRRSMKISSIIISLPVILFCIYGIQFYKLWQPTLDASKLSMLSFLTMMAFIPLAGTQVLYNVFTSTNRLKWNSISFLFCGLVNTVLVYILFKYSTLGVYAIAGVSSTITIIRNVAFVLPYAAYLLDTKWYTFYKEVLISLLFGICIFLVSFGTQKLIVPNSWISFLVSVTVAGIISLFVAWFLFLNNHEREILKRKVKRSNG